MISTKKAERMHCSMTVKLQLRSPNLHLTVINPSKHDVLDLGAIIHFERTFLFASTTLCSPGPSVQ